MKEGKKNRIKHGGKAWRSSLSATMEHKKKEVYRTGQAIRGAGCVESLAVCSATH